MRAGMLSRDQKALKVAILQKRQVRAALVQAMQLVEDVVFGLNLRRGHGFLFQYHKDVNTVSKRRKRQAI